jgi:hypothetical protein
LSKINYKIYRVMEWSGVGVEVSRVEIKKISGVGVGMELM